MYRSLLRNDYSNEAEVTLVKDKLTGSTVALTSVAGYKEGDTRKLSQKEIQEAMNADSDRLDEIARTRTEKLTTYKMRAFVLDRDKVDLRKVSENDAAAKKVLGLSKDANLAGETISDMYQWEVDNDADIETLLSPQGIKKTLDSQEKAPKVEFPGTKGDTGIAVHNAMVDSYFEKIAPEVKDKAMELRQMQIDRFEGNVPEDEDEGMAYYEKFLKLTDEVDNLQTEAYRGLVNPAHFIRDPHREIGQGVVFSDGVDLTNNWANLEGDETTPLNDVEQKFSIGKVDPEMTKASPNIKDGDTVTNSIRLINNKTNEEYNLYSIETEDTKPGKTSGWIRIDKVVDGKPVASNQDAMDEIGIKMYQVPMGPGESEFTKETITPEGLRSITTERQILDNEKRFKLENDAGEFHVDSYLGKTGMSDLWDSDEELQATAVVVNSHFNLQELSASKIDKLEDMGLIPGSDSKGNNYIGTLNAFYITERGKNGNDILFGQNSIEFTDNYKGARPSRSMNEYYTEIPSSGFNRDAVSGERGYTETLKHVNLTPIMDAQRSYIMPGGQYEFAGGPAEVFNRKTEQVESAGEAWTAAYGKPDIVDAILLEAANENKWDKNYAAKPDNMFGLGEKHEVLAQYDRSIGLDNDNELDLSYESDKGLEATEPENASRRSHAKP